jgi:hypothetical protein
VPTDNSFNGTILSQYKTLTWARDVASMVQAMSQALPIINALRQYPYHENWRYLNVPGGQYDW